MKVNKLIELLNEASSKREKDLLFIASNSSSDYLKILNHPKVAFYHQPEQNGITPLHNIAKWGDLETLSHPAIAKARDKNLDTPLHYLASLVDIVKNKKEFYKALLAHPEISKVKNKYGNTPLHTLSTEDNSLMFMDHPDMNTVENQEGLTPLEYYCDINDKDPEKIMKEYGKKQLKKINFQPLTKRIDLD